jgi:UDP-2-acetamido-3-amino-2,3-dideoxy-glucuronate N-acetyltransferase
MSYWAHPTAIIDTPVSIGDATRIWHFTHVMANARIGARCALGQNVFVASRAVVGDGCRIQNNVSVYEGVELADDVFVGPSAVFTNVVNPRAFVQRRDQLRRTPVGRGATIGANATIVCGTEIGDYAFIAAGAVVTADVPPFALMGGVPARRIGWICRCGVTLPKARAGGKGLRCAACGSGYRLAGRGKKARLSARAP